MLALAVDKAASEAAPIAVAAKEKPTAPSETFRHARAMTPLEAIEGTGDTPPSECGGMAHLSNQIFAAEREHPVDLPKQ